VETEEKIINISEALKPRMNSDTIIKGCILLIIILSLLTGIIGFNYLELSENYKDLEKINKEGIESSNARIKQLNEEILDYSIYVVDGFMTFNALMLGQAWMNENPDAMKNFRQNQYISFELYEDPEIDKFLDKYKECTENYDQNCTENDFLLNEYFYESMHKRYTALLKVDGVEE